MEIDARKTMGELNYLIEEISEFWEQRNYIHQELINRGLGFGLLGGLGIFLISFLGAGLIIFSIVSMSDIARVPVTSSVGILGIAVGSGLILYGGKLYKKDKKVQKGKEIAKLLKSKEKELDNFIKQEWNPRIKMLKDNSVNYFSDKELRNKYNGFMQTNIEVQRLTRSGQRMQEFTKTLKVAGIATVAVTGAVLGGMSAANKQFNKQ
jgi:xanthosine utilization system XapX-like protein